MKFVRLLAAIGFAAAAFAGIARAQEIPELAPPPAQNVTDIAVEFIGTGTIDKARILANMQTKVGDVFSEALAEQDVKSIYESGDVENVRILTQDFAGGVRVIVRVQPRASLAEISFIGNSKLSNDRLSREIALQVGQPFTDSQLLIAQQDIEKLYLDKGFTDVTVTYNLKEGLEAGTSRVTFVIDEGERKVLSDIRFEGNTIFSDRELRKVMELKPSSIWKVFGKKAGIDKQTLEDDITRIEDHYRNAGYLNAAVTDATEEADGGDKVALIISVSEGEKYSVASVALEGMTVFSNAEIEPALAVTAGSDYSKAAIEADVQTIRNYYGSKGYSDTRISPRLQGAGGNQVGLTYSVTEGGKFFVRRIDIEGNDKTQDRVIRREAAITPGEPYDTNKIDATKSRLENLNYFSDVDITSADTEDSNYKDIRITVREKSTGTINFGAGFSSIDNLVGFFDITQSNFDATNWPRFTGAGQKFRFGVKYGTRRKDFILSLTEPWFMGQRLSLTGEVFYTDKTFLSDDYDQTEFGGTLRTRKPIGEHSFFTAAYTAQQVEIHDIDPKASDIIKAEEGEFFQSKLDGEITFDNRDSIFIPRRGQKVSVGVATSGEFLGGDVDVYGFNTEGQKYWLLPGDTIFSVEGRAAVVDAWTGRVPIFERLFLGGANNLRGFDYRDVGPKDEFGEPIGGQTAVNVTAEYTFPIIEKVRGAVFYDWGFVNADSWDFSAADANSNFGVGLRLYLPVGPIKLDVGIPVQSDEFNDSDAKFNFNIGYKF